MNLMSVISTDNNHTELIKTLFHLITQSTVIELRYTLYATKSMLTLRNFIMNHMPLIY